MSSKHRAPSFEERLEDYSQSSENALKKTSSLGNTASYCVAGTAAALAIGTTEAEAAIFVTEVNQTLNPTSGDSESFVLDIAGFGHPMDDFLFEAALDDNPGGARDWFRVSDRNGNQIVGSVYSASFNFVSRFTSGQSISSGLNLLPADGIADSYLASSQHPTYAASGNWLGGNTGFIGFQLASGNFGWIEVTVDAAHGSGTILRYGVESTAGVPIMAGVPEPNSLACLALGAAGLLGWRQRRNNAA